MDAIREIEPYAWVSLNVLTGKEYIQKLPITSLQPGVYKNFPLYDAKTLASKEAEVVRMRAALLEGAQRIEAMKRDCGADPESPTAIQNSRYMGVSYFLRAALTQGEKE